jgi:hypothetical protein
MDTRYIENKNKKHQWDRGRACAEGEEKTNFFEKMMHEQGIGTGEGGREISPVSP